MAIKTLTELGEIADLCRKKGIESIRITNDAVEFRLAPQKTRSRRPKPKEDNTPIQTDRQYTEDEILFFSSSGIPEHTLGEN